MTLTFKQGLVLVIVLCSVFSGLINIPQIPKAEATPLSYNVSNISPPVNTFVGGTNNQLIFDINGNGIVDAIYNLTSYSSSSVTFIKVFGSLGQTTVTFSAHAGYSLSTNLIAIPDGKTLYIAESNLTTHNIQLIAIDVTTGGTSIVAGPITNGNISGSADTVGGFKLVNGTYVFGGFYASSVGVLVNGGGTVLHTFNSGVFFTPAFIGMGNEYTVTFDGHVYTNSPLPANNGGIANCDDVNGCLMTFNGAPTRLYTSSIMGSSGYFGDRGIRIVGYGIEIPHNRNTLGVSTTGYIKDLLVGPNMSNSTEITLYLPDYILNTLGISAGRFLLENGVNFYIGETSGNYVYYNGLSYFTSQYTNRTFQYILPSRSGDELGQLPIGNGYPQDAQYGLILPTGVKISVSTNVGGVVMPSGYNILDVWWENRYIDARWSGYATRLPFVVYDFVNTGSYLPLTLQIKGITNPDYAIMLSDENPINGTSEDYVWAVQPLATDKSVTFQLPMDRCLDVSIKDISQLAQAWQLLGNVCANGPSVKSITFVSNIAFTFWTLPWGVTHTYNGTTHIVTTDVRHSTTPYQYDVKIYDKSKNLVVNQHYNTTNSLDIRTQNLTSYNAPPYHMFIYDNSTGAQLYQTYLDDNPRYLSSLKPFFDQYFTFAGWNVLFFMPIIFSAMFTRNTVGIGTILTVMLIATMNWLGLIDLPAEVVLLLVFVSIIGLLAYRVLF